MRGTALIVLAWNKWALTRRCLDSLLASSLHAAEVIVVDNGSSDETPEALAAYAGRVRIITLPENLGFVRGMNAGIDAARPDDDVVLLNNDLAFTQPDWLERLRDAAYAAPEHGIVGCRLLGPEAGGRVYHVGGFIEPDELWGQQTEAGILERDVGQYTRTRRVEGIAFALAYLRRDCLDRIGALDTAYHSYFEDTDYCLRASDAGIASVVAGAVTLRHDQHGSTQDDGGFRQRLWDASRATFAARWQQRLHARYRGTLLWQGTTRFPTVHAHLARAFVRRLDARGVRVAYQSTVREMGDAQDFRLDLAGRRRVAPPADVAIVCAPGAHLAQANGRYRIGIGSGDWQRVPPSWANATQALDLLVVPDAFQHDAYRAAGVRTPIEVLSFGVDADYCHPRVPVLRNPRGNFVFLAVAEDFQRDAPDLLVAAFRRTFRSEEPAELVIHVRAGRDAAAITASLARIGAGDPRVHVIEGWEFPWHQRAQLLCGADAYVSARRGGGWEPLAAEAVACGRTLVATAFGSNDELVRRHGLAVDVARLVRDPAYPDLLWAEPDADSLAACLRTAFSQPLPTPVDLQARARAFAAAHDIEDSAARLLELCAGGNTLAPARALPAPHQPVQLARPPSGQIVILGMHRSGTSSVAGLLARMGVSVGPEDDLLRGPDNPKGHYESGRLHMACVRRLAAAGGDWRVPPIEAPGTAIDAFRQEIGALIDEFDAQLPWLIKEPRLCLVACDLLPLLTRPVFVHVVRDPGEVADSLAVRDGFERDAALALWEQYTRAAFAASRGWPRVLVDYAELVADPLKAAHRLRDDLRALGIDGVAEPDAAVVRAWIEPSPPRARAAAASGLSEAQRALQAAITDRSILAADAGAAVARDAG